MYLSLWGKFLILGAGGVLAVVAVTLIACFVGPGCWGFEYLRREEKKRNSVQLIQRKIPSYTSRPKYFWLENGGDVSYETTPFETRVSKLNEVPVHRSKEVAFGVKCAPLLVAPSLYSRVKTSSPKLQVKIFYSGLDPDGIAGRLTIQIISVSFLPCREYINTLDPSVAVEILNSKWFLQKNERIAHSVQTGVVKNNSNPTFNESFVFDAKKIEIKNWSLKFTVLDNDRLTKVTPMFERRLYLKDMKNLTQSSHFCLNLEMQEVTGNVGEIFFGISYLPTAQRLNISVVKAAKLKHQTSLGEFYPYVRVVMVNNHGKCVKKKKTCVRHAEENPVFDQCLVFDLSISNLEQTVFLVLLCTRALCRYTNSDDSSLDGDIETTLRESRDKVLGAVVLGRNVKCTKARDHWVAVMQNPRKTISVWHDLK